MSRRKRRTNTTRPIPYTKSGPLATPLSYKDTIEAVETGARIANDSFGRGLEAGRPKQLSKTRENTVKIASVLYVLVLLAAILLCLAQFLPSERLPEFILDKELAEKALTYVLAQLPLLAKIMLEK
jgi:hypothetical protein